MSNHKAPFDWVRKVREFIPEAAEIPLFGNAQPFDWDRLSSLLAARFEAADFSVRPTKQVWCESDEIEEGLAANCFIAAVFLNPLKSPLYFAIPKADRNKLAAWMMQGKAKSQISEPLKEGFCRFLILEALEASSAIDPISKLTPWLAERANLPQERSFCIDIELSFANSSCWGRLILPSSFRKEWVEHFSGERAAYISSETAKSIELILGVECGSVLLTQGQWDDIEPGDFVILDSGSYDAANETGMGILKLGSVPLFQTKLTQNKLELLDYAFTQEEKMEQNSEGILMPADEETGSIKDIEVNVSVELARLRITLDYLMHLNPGNTLELPIHPDQGVVLTVNGKKVGRAELLHLGESLGIRILEIGK